MQLFGNGFGFQKTWSSADQYGRLCQWDFIQGTTQCDKGSNDNGSESFISSQQQKPRTA